MILVQKELELQCTGSVWGVTVALMAVEVREMLVELRLVEVMDQTKEQNFHYNLLLEADDP